MVIGFRGGEVWVQGSGFRDLRFRGAGCEGFRGFGLRVQRLRGSRVFKFCFQS